MVFGYSLGTDGVGTTVMRVAEIKNLSYSYTESCGQKKAVSDVSFSIEEGKCLGLIGESGSGKSTVGSLLAGFMSGYDGEICLMGRNQDMAGLSRAEKHRIYRDVQMVFQDPWQSFPPHMRVGEGIAEGLRYYQKELGLSDTQVRQKVGETMEQVGLPDRYYNKKCRELSGGECQRAAIGRAIVRAPRLLICDEVTSALDVSIQAQIMQLLAKLKKDTGMAYLFISHDLALVGAICDRVCVMKDGHLVEELPGGREMYEKAQHTYTKLLMASVLRV